MEVKETRGAKKKVVEPVVDGEFVSISEASRRTKFSRSTIYTMIKDKRLESTFFAGRTVVKVNRKKR